ncbi:MAG: PAS domain-containing protein [Chitinophagales bacterium]
MMATPYTKTLRTVSLSMAAAALTIALFTILAWWIPLPGLIGPHSGTSLMNPMSAVGFLISFLALCCSWLSTDPRYRVCKVLSVLLLIGGMLRLVDGAFHLQLRPDLYLFQWQGSAAIPRMGIFTALNFCLLAPALFFSCSNAITAKKIANRFAAATLLSSLFFLIGYLYQVREFLSMMHYLPMSCYAAVCFAMMGVALLCRHPEAAFMKTFTSNLVGGTLARKLLPVILLLPVVLGFLRLWIYWRIPFSVELGVALLITVIIGVFFSLTWLLATTLNRSDEARTNAENRLRDFNGQLEMKVTERTLLLANSEARFRETLESLSEGAQFIDRQWRYSYLNASAVNQGRKSKEELIGKTMMECFPGIEKTELFQVMNEVMTYRTMARFENEFQYADGSSAFYELSIQPSPEGIFILSTDVTAHRIAHNKLVKSNRLYSFISQINQRVVHSNNIDELLHQTCDIAMRIGGFKLAWMAWVDDSGKMVYGAVRGNLKVVRQTMEYTGVNLREELFSDTPAGRVFRTGKACISNDLLRNPGLQQWHLQFMNMGLRSGAAFPIKKAGKMIGIFGFYSDKVDFFDGEETALLIETVNDISFALEMIELRDHRLIAEKQLAQSEYRLQRAQQLAHVGHWERHLETGILYWSDEMCRIYGIENGKQYDTVEKWIKCVHPEDRDALLATVRLSDQTHNDIKTQFRIVRPNGEIRWVRSEGKYQLDENGRVIGLHGVVQDITDYARDNFI